MKKIVICLLVFVTVISCKKQQDKKVKTFENTNLSGIVFGTSYNAIYDSEIDYSKQFDSLFDAINKSLSTYQSNSIISGFNRDGFGSMDSHFRKVYDAAGRIYRNTKGVFDPTIGAVVNAWDFGPEGKIENIDSLKINNLMKSIGYNKLHRIHNDIYSKGKVYLDFNAIAKGYGVDVISEFLESKNINNYLVEIGGEIRVSGENKEKHKPWRVGLDEPRFDGGQSVFKAVNLKDEAMATSGTYRKFKVDDNGNKYAHIINTKTGYPTKTNVLSVSVIAKDCMTADGYATAFQAMGVEGVKTFLQNHPELKVFLIFENENKALETLSLNGFPE